MSDGTDVGDPPPRHPASHYQPKPALAVTLLVLFVACVVLVLHYLAAVPVGGHAGSTTTTTHPPTTTTTVPRSKVTVQVANGTDHNNLAGTYTDQLSTDGWDTLPAINGPATQTTTISYRPAYRWAADKVRIEIKAPASSLHKLGKRNPLSPTADTGDDVIVILGNNAAT